MLPLTTGNKLQPSNLANCQAIVLYVKFKINSIVSVTLLILFSFTILPKYILLTDFLKLFLKDNLMFPKLINFRSDLSD